MVEAIQIQRMLNHELAELLYDIEENKDGATLLFIGVSFLYGLLHSLGAGHGKVLVSSYLISNQGTIAKAIVIATTTALLQALVAIVLVESMLTLYASSMRDVHSAVASTIRISYFCVICAGFVVMFNAVTSKRRSARPHGIYSIIIAVGLRPCTGAVMILLFSNMVGLSATGIISAIFMAWGTAITTSLIACFAVVGKNTFSSLLPRKKPVKLIQFVGGSFVALFGYLLLTTEQYINFIEILNQKE